jgi:hypothetical protein
MNVICPDFRAYHWSAEKLSKSTIANPKFGTCCSSGKVLPGHLEDIPIELHHLYFGTDNQSKKFLENIRRYNNPLALGRMHTRGSKLTTLSMMAMVLGCTRSRANLIMSLEPCFHLLDKHQCTPSSTSIIQTLP